jgi:glutaminyl-tRNA synthetase
VTHDDPDTRYQFERVGYFWRDPGSPDDEPVFNRIVTLRDTWARRAAQGGTPSGEGRRDSETGTVGAEGKAKGVSGKAGDEAATPGDPGRPPELSPEARARAEALVAELALDRNDAEILAREPEAEAFLRAAGGADPRAGAGPLANWIINELPPVQGDRPLEALPFGPEEFAELVALVEEGTLSSSGGREVLGVLAREGGSPPDIVKARDLAQVSDPDTLEPVILRILEAHPRKVRAYIEGKKGLQGFFMGQIMRETRGKANPELAKRLLRKMLGE